TDVYRAWRVAGKNAVLMPLLGITTLEDVGRAAFPKPGASPASADALLDAIETLPGLPASPTAVVPRGESCAAGAVAVAARVAAADLSARQRKAAGAVAWPDAADIPVPVVRLVEACLAPSPAARPTAAEAARGLAGWLAAERGEVTARRRRVAVGLAVGVVILA